MIYNVVAYKVLNKMIFLQSNYTYSGIAPQYRFSISAIFYLFHQSVQKIFLANMHSK